MPAVLPPATVLVTGASGFTAVWVTRSLLAAGYKARGTVRTDSKAAYLQGVFKDFASSF